MSDHIYPVKRQNKDKRDVRANVSRLITIPTKVDLRNDAPEVFNQLELGSCSAQVGVATMMMLESKAKNVSIDQIETLSRLFLYYQERLMEGNVNEDSGATMRTICKTLSKVGVCEEKLWPYITNKFTEIPSQEAMNNANNHKVRSYKSLTSLNEIRQYIAVKNLPVMIGMEIYPSFESDEVAKTGLVSLPKKGEENLGGHAVLVVGYDDNFTFSNNNQCKVLSKIVRFVKGNRNKGALIVRNSWSDLWGDKGYFYLPYEFILKNFAFDFWTMEL